MHFTLHVFFNILTFSILVILRKMFCLLNLFSFLMSLVSGFGIGYFVLFPKRRGKVAVYFCLFVCFVLCCLFSSIY